MSKKGKRQRQRGPRSRPPIGASPGTLVLPPTAVKPRIRVFRYDEQRLEQYDIDRPAELRPLLDGQSICWVDVQGLGDEAVLREMADVFSIHPIALEDIVHVPQRPKTEGYEKNRHVVFRMVDLTADRRLDPDQLSLFFNQSYVVTFQEQYGDCFDPLRERLISNTGQMRKSGADYMAYALIDAVLDAYHPVLEALGEELEELEHVVVDGSSRSALMRINEIRRDLMTLRRAVLPQREALNSLIRDDEVFVTPAVRVYLRDCYNQCVQLADTVEMLREIGSGLLNIYLSAVANRTNEVMKVLTIMSSIFIPLTFVVGIYGMNFDFMPELRWRPGYPLVLAVMATVAIGMLLYFRRLGWLSRLSRPARDRPRPPEGDSPPRPDAR